MLLLSCTATKYKDTLSFPSITPTDRRRQNGEYYSTHSMNLVYSFLENRNALNTIYKTLKKDEFNMQKNKLLKLFDSQVLLDGNREYSNFV